MYFSKGNNMSAVSFLESGSILAFTSDDVEINGEVLRKSGAIRFTKKYMVYPSIINTSNGEAYVDVYLSLGNSNYDCIIDWGDNTLEQFKLVEIDSKTYKKKLAGQGQMETASSVKDEGQNENQMCFLKGNNISAVSFLESGSILAFTSEDVEINGVVLRKSGAIRFTSKYMIYPSIITTSNGQANVDVYWSLGNSNYDCIIDWGNNVLEQFKLVEIDYKTYQKKKAAKELEEQKEKERKELELQSLTKKVSSKLDSLMKISEFTKAAELYIEKNGELSLSSYYQAINDGLVKSYAKDTVYLSDAFTMQFIEKNKEKLKKFAPDTYVLHFGLNGDEKRFLDLKIDKKDLSVKKIGLNMQNVKKGDFYLGGMVINISDKEIVICSKKPLGFGTFTEGQKFCQQFKINGQPGRLPTPDELKTIFDLKDKLDSYENNWYWTNNERSTTAEHIGIQRRDQTFVPKEHGKFVFAVQTVPINSFEIPLTTCMKFTVAEEKNKLVRSEMTSSSNKPIYKLDESTYCLKSTGNSNNVSFNYSKDVPKNILRIEKTFESIKRINNTIISKEVNSTKVEHVLSKKCE
jgi:hypothetical protein